MWFSRQFLEFLKVARTLVPYNPAPLTLSRLVLASPSLGSP